MQLTPFGLVLMLCAVPVFLASAYQPWLVTVGVAWMVGVAALAVIDSIFTRKRSRFEARRVVEEKMSLGAENPVVLRLRSRCPGLLRLQVKDTPPVEFSTPERKVPVSVPAHEEATGRYLTTPTARGDFQFGDIHVRGTGLLRLSTWQVTVPAKTQVRVYPNLLEVRRYEELARRDRLQEEGFRPIGFRGRGTEFESLREYVRDDEFKDIDWKATARRRKPITRQYEVERSQNVLLMIDAGRMMTGEVEGMSKLDHAVNAALMLAHVAAGAGDTVGMLAFGREIKSYVPPRKGKAQVGRILEQLYALQPTLDEPDYRAAFTALAERCRKRALVAIFTDLVDAEASQRLLAHTAALRSRHLPLLLTTRDVGLARASTMIPHEPEDVYTRAIAGDVLAQRESALTWLRSRGALAVDVPAPLLTVSAVNQYLRIKAAGRL